MALLTSMGVSSHKRSKSSLALSMLHRDKSKREDRADDTPSPASSVADSPTTSTHGFGNYLRPYRSRPNIPEADSPVSNYEVHTDVPPSSLGVSTPDPGLSIEQSVRQFRFFEILRSGDKNAISKAFTGASTPAGGNGTVSESPSSKPLEGTTILHLAIQCADPTIVDYILSLALKDQKGLTFMNEQDKTGNTPLHLASMLGRVSIVRALLKQAQVDDSVQNFQGQTPIDLARNPEIFQQLQLFRALYIESNIKEVHELVRAGNRKGLEQLFEDPRVQAFVDVNGAELATEPATVESGGTLLHEAARKRDLSLIQLLLLHGADPFRRDRKGKLPQDVTKDERTKAILKKSPAAAAAQRGVQEKAILSNPLAENPLAGKEGREIKGYLKKWTNYTTGYKLRWFVLEDGVLSYYKNQDDAGSACRGAINMRIARLIMDAQDKTRFEIQGKSSVKYHLKANHVVEAKRWFWALNNAIQWAKDEAKSAEQQQRRPVASATDDSGHERDLKRVTSKGLTSATAVDLGAANASQISIPTSTIADGEDSEYVRFDQLGTESFPKLDAKGNTVPLPGDLDDDEEFDDDASDRILQPAPKDAFNITANSANLQLDLLGQVSAALRQEAVQRPETTIANPAISQAMVTYEGAVQSLKSMVADLLKIARDRDAYWQYRLDREADMRHLWEDSMAKVAKEQEELESRIGESEMKRRKTKRALKEALDTSMAPSRSGSVGFKEGEELQIPVTALDESQEVRGFGRRKSLGTKSRRATISALTDLSDSDGEDDEEFFDAVDAGEVEIIEKMPESVAALPASSKAELEPKKMERKQSIALSNLDTSYKGYEDPLRKRLKMDADDRPKISLWGILKSMIGKDMTKMTLPVSFNEPTSLLQRVAEDMEYTDLLDIAADRADSTERLVYVAAFAASEYASTIGRVAKPFNPLLGETYEYARPDKGFRFFVEQVSHHPPIGAAWAESAKWDYYGESAVKSKFYGKSFDINPLGTWFLKLRTITGEEELYTWKKVTSSVIGIITGSPTVDNYGPQEIKNWNTGEVCILDFKPRGWKASSAYQVSGKVMTADGKTRWSMGGRWNERLYARLTPGFDTDVSSPQGGSAAQLRAHEPGSNQAFLVWEAHERPAGIPFSLTPFGVTLNALPDSLRPWLPPTDTRLRPDQRAMEDGKYDFAATEKTRLEEKQRAVRRNREEKGEEFVPRWFRKGKCEVTGEEYWIFNGEYWKVRNQVGETKAAWSGIDEIF
ncbi:hypothetical protein MMC25_008225 [Agyrium rufum]|nr:hypothetical protein [Agyrium rufum]